MTVLHEKESFDGPLATKYGVLAMPTALLVDQQGKVVLNFARTQIQFRIERLLGPAR